ncbi:DMT family transporter [Sphaerisporangium sp. NPDC088356]|uniref:DMT family transporter n=1 Tax=Sphaerisporangium sp. NPDC088356 TaxID=3154871 RepID=UPI0034244A7C
MISVVLALLAAAGNATASVLQRRAARSVPKDKAFRPALVLALVRDPVWLGGIAALVGGFLFQAAALSVGALALVQPVLVIELPFTMVLLSWMFGVKLDRRSWLAVGTVTVGVSVFLVSAAPGPGRQTPTSAEWVMATVVTIGTVIGLVMVARLFTGAGRAAALGVATGVGFAFTATFIKESTSVFQRDPAALPASWQLYAMVVAGLCSLFLLQNALHSGPLVAAQPALTVSDPVAGILYGTTMFGEHVRTGHWILLEATGITLIIYGSFRLAKSLPSGLGHKTPRRGHESRLGRTRGERGR